MIPEQPAAVAPADVATAAMIKDVDEFLDTEGEENALATHIRQAFDRAADERRSSGIEERMLKAQRALRMEYDPEDLSLIEKGQDIYLGVIALKCRAAESWISDIMTNEGKKPWTASATPIPDLPEAQKEAIIRMVRQELVEMMQGGLTPDVEDLAIRVDNLKDSAMRITNDEAKERAGRMETTIADQMVEGKFFRAFKEMLTDLVAMPIGCIVSPTVKSVKKMQWENNKAVVKKVFALCSERYSPFDVYPSPDSKTPQDGEYMCLRSRIPYSDVLDMLDMPGFIEDNVQRVLDQFGDVGVNNNTETLDSEREHLEDRPEVYDDRSNRFEVVKFYGKVRAQMLAEAGVEVADVDAIVEAEGWTIGGILVRAILSPHPTERRPIFTTSFRKVPGSFWGQGLFDILKDIGRVCNASARSLVRNMAYSSGPMGEVDTSRLADNERPDQIHPLRLYHVDPDLTGSGRQAFTFYKVDSNASELIAVYDHYSKLADDHSGVPAYVIGSPNVGGAGRTMGGLSMLLGNAAKGIKHVISNIDIDIFSEVVTSMFELNMKYNPDPDIKGDINIIAMGSRGLLQRELSQTRAVELLQLLTPYAQAGIIPPAAVVKLIKEIIESMGYDPSMIPDSEIVDAGQQAALAAQQQQPAPDGGQQQQLPQQPQPLAAGV